MLCSPVKIPDVQLFTLDMNSWWRVCALTTAQPLAPPESDASHSRKKSDNYVQSTFPWILTSPDLSNPLECPLTIHRRVQINYVEDQNEVWLNSVLTLVHSTFPLSTSPYAHVIGLPLG